jgi:preprotein translocase subunit YajC
VSYLPLILVAVVLVVAFSLSRRNRQRAVTAQQEQRRQIGFGTEVMTTSGLYGTVVGVNDDDTVQLSIAPGVEVKWALAALRDVASLPNADNRGDGPDEPTDSDGPIDPHDPPRL